MGQIPLSLASLPTFPLVGEELVGTARAALHLRCLHLQENTLEMVGRLRAVHSHRHELGGCFGFRSRSGLFHQLVFLSELRHPFFFFGEDDAHGRLPFGK